MYDPSPTGKATCLAESGEGAEAAGAASVVEQIEQSRQQVDVSTVDLDAELEGEPVGTAGLRLDRRVPGQLPIDDAVGEGLVDLDAEAEPPELGHDPGAEAAVVVDVAVAAHDVVRIDAGRHGVVVETLEVDGAEALEHAPRMSFGRLVAWEGGEACVGRPEEALLGIGGTEALTVVVEGQGDEGQLAGLEVAAVVAAIDDDLIGEEADAGDEGGRRNRGGIGEPGTKGGRLGRARVRSRIGFVPGERRHGVG